jgi:membrane protein required for colicin V production
MSLGSVSFFDLAAGLLLLVSVLVGWIRGGAREAAGIAALVVAALVAFLALRFTGPIARHAIHTPWLANLAAVLAVFAAVYVLLRVLAASLSRGLHRTAALGALDRAVGAGFGLARALTILGLVTLTLSAVIPPPHTPSWISGAHLYPVATASAGVLTTFAPKGEALAAKVAPMVGNALAQAPDSSQNPGETDASNSLKIDVGRAR